MHTASRVRWLAPGEKDQQQQQEDLHELTPRLRNNTSQNGTCLNRKIIPTKPGIFPTPWSNSLRAMFCAIGFVVGPATPTQVGIVVVVLKTVIVACFRAVKRFRPDERERHDIGGVQHITAAALRQGEPLTSAALDTFRLEHICPTTNVPMFGDLVVGEVWNRFPKHVQTGDALGVIRRRVRCGLSHTGQRASEKH